MARGGHGLLKVSPEGGPLTRVAHPQGWPAQREGGLWPSSCPLDTPRRTPMELTFGRGGGFDLFNREPQSADRLTLGANVKVLRLAPFAEIATFWDQFKSRKYIS
jgi:hypothetical protein